MSISLEHLPANSTLVALIEIITKAVEGTAGLSVKIDNVATQQTSLAGKVDRVSEGIAELKEKTSNVSQAVESLRTNVIDHEARLRALEPKASRVIDVEAELTKLKDAVNAKDAEHEKAIQAIEKTIIRYAAYAAVGLFVLQTALTLFVGPWLSTLLVR